MTKKPVRKIQLNRETIRNVTNEQLTHVAGGSGTTSNTCSLHETTGPFPSHGPCNGSIIFV